MILDRSALKDDFVAVCLVKHKSPKQVPLRAHTNYFLDPRNYHHLNSIMTHTEA